MPKPCTVDACDKPHLARGFCAAHYRRWSKTGDPQATMPVKVQRRKGEGISRRDIFLRNRYGISLVDFDGQLRAQGGRCALCRTSEPGGRGMFCVDHDHTCDHGPDATPSITGCRACIRGLLCDVCNQNRLPHLEWGIAHGLVLPSTELTAYLSSRAFQEVARV